MALQGATGMGHTAVSKAPGLTLGLGLGGFVDGIALHPFGPRLLLVVQLLHGRLRLPGPGSLGAKPQRLLQVPSLARVEIGGGRRGLLGAGVHQPGRRGQAAAQAGQLERNLQHLGPPLPGRFVPGQRPSPTDVALGDLCCVRRQAGLDPIAGLQQLGDGGDTGCLQG